MVNGSGEHVKRADLLVVRQIRVQRIERRLDCACISRVEPLRADGDERRKKAALIADAAPPAALPEAARRALASSGSGAMLCPELRMIRFFSRPVMRQLPLRVHFALVARVKPAALERFRRFRGPLPVARKNIRPANQNFAVLARRVISIPGIAGPTRPGSTCAGSSIVQMAVVSVSPYTCSTGMPSIMKKSCVSSARGAEPQISAFRFGPMLLRIAGNIRRVRERQAQESISARSRLAVPLADKLAARARKWPRSHPPRF